MSEIRNVGLGEIALEVGEQTPSEQVVCRFPGRRVFITGGGRVLVESFCHAGCRVAFCDRVAGDRTALESGARFFPLDVCDAEALEACLQGLFAEWGDLDVVISNVGISLFSPIEQTSVTDFDRILATNLRPAFITSRALARHRRSLPSPNPYGRIINISSTRHLMSEPGSEGYAASKGGICSLTHARPCCWQPCMSRSMPSLRDGLNMPTMPDCGPKTIPSIRRDVSAGPRTLHGCACSSVWSATTSSMSRTSPSMGV